MIRERKLLMVAVGLVLMAGLAKVERRGPKPPFASSQAIPPARVALASDYGKLPLSFERNMGQSDRQVKFLSRGNGYSLFLTDKEAVLALHKSASAERDQPVAASGGRHGDRRKPSIQADVVGMQLQGATRDLRVSGEEQLQSTVNYFIGNDPKQWHSSVPTFGKVKYANVYPGVDLVYYGNQQQ